MTNTTIPPLEENHVIIFGDCWPVVSAVKNVVTTIRPEYTCNIARDLSSIIYHLAREPRAVLVLCLRPHEHIFLFYALKEEMIYHPTLVISDEILFSDKVVLSAWGQIPWMMHQELELMITSQQLCELYPSAIRYCPEKSTLTNFLMTPVLPSGFPEVPQIFHLEERLMDYMSLLMYREMLNRGLTPFRIRILEAIWRGHQTRNELAEILDEPRGKIWNEKYRLLAQLGMSARLRDMLYGTHFCLFLQRTPFMSLSKAGEIREKARVSQKEVSPDFPAGTAA